VLILAGDHLYRMDYAEMIARHEQSKADVTVAVQPVAKEDAGRFGLLLRKGDGRIVEFQEKPKDPAVRARMACRDDPDRPYLGSMGIYLFRTDVMFDLLTSKPDQHDFGSDILPRAIGNKRVFAYDFDGFWEDVGTIRSYYDTNLKLVRADSPFNFYDAKRPIYTHSRFLPSSIVQDSRLKDVLISEGSHLEGADVTNSVVGLRSRIGPGSVVKDSIVMGADYFDEAGPTEIPLGIGRGCHIEGAILDKNVRIGDRVEIRPFPRGFDRDAGDWVVQDGIVVIPKDTILPVGTKIGP
jgi:glucose-1-phosphate adenylyltransferase